jgi:hypothetical protein
VRIRLWIAVMLFTSTNSAFAQDLDVENLARPERMVLAKCLSQALTVIEKHRPVQWIHELLGAACAGEIERVETAAKYQLKDEVGQVALGRPSGESVTSWLGKNQWKNDLGRFWR